MANQKTMMKTMRHEVKIRNKEWYSPDIFGMTVRIPNVRPLPGQFFQIRVGAPYDPFLNRPISIARYQRGEIHLIIQVVGRGTGMLSSREAGEKLVLFGPFGTGIRPVRKKSLIVAGGIGVAPLLFVAQHLQKQRVPFTFLYGARHKQDLILTKTIRKISKESAFVAEQGYAKQKTVLQELASRSVKDFERIYTCGPRSMLVEMQRMSLPMPVFAFCEDFLGCGCGLCLGCAIKFKGEYKRICEDGPVFELSGIDFNG